MYSASLLIEYYKFQHAILFDLCTVLKSCLITSTLSNISLILDYHKQLDKINESILNSEKKIGTTSKGIGPAYQDKVGRKSIKLYDLKSQDIIKEKILNIKKFYDPILERFDESRINIEKTDQVK